MSDDSGLPWVWRSRSPLASAARALLGPLELAYFAATATRNALYDRGALPAVAPPIPALSVGNLTVGGTGKTPIAAWAAGELRRRGATPAIVLRGFGDDEQLVHGRLSPGVPVIVAPDRLRGAAEARAVGADVIVLDDAFQHRRIARSADWVLISADRWTGRRHLLPAGPWREPLGALARGTVAIVTRKAASPADAAAVAAEVRAAAGGIPVVVVHLALDALHSADTPDTRALESLLGARVLLLSGIGDPGALRAQLAAEGAVVQSLTFPDHHAFTDAELAEAARAAGDDMVVCTLKDAVKVAARWPRGAPPIWYVSQRVRVEDGVDALARSLESVLRARTPAVTPAGASRPSL